MASTIDDLYTTGLANAHALENQAVQMLSRQAERLENYPELAQRMREHIEESRRHAARLDEILRARGSAPSALKDVGQSIIGSLAAMTHAAAQDEVLKNSFANYAFEHYEIAAYRSLLVLADAVGDAWGMKLLRESLAEEERMAQWIADHLEPTTRTYMRLAATGQKAGV
ncbi:YciE/YciF family protein [Caldovatus sediminis]|uniref:YciE/YciF family protein n=1 Tax=Caldovatus sediminis TaxID=2041189 RepID=A0A8J3EDK9_9PROT|nr:ferritin-like domain-containing protein [Caldovatus sediminis]GGG45478.1 YciE/YciF family protein [Caldovatus sediminis]